MELEGFRAGQIEERIDGAFLDGRRGWASSTGPDVVGQQPDRPASDVLIGVLGVLGQAFEKPLGPGTTTACRAQMARRRPGFFAAGRTRPPVGELPAKALDRRPAVHEDRRDCRDSHSIRIGHQRHQRGVIERIEVCYRRNWRVP